MALAARFQGKRGTRRTAAQILAGKPPPPKGPGGRPREHGDVYDPETVTRLVKLIASGMGVTPACKSDPTLPTDDAVWLRMAVDDEFAELINKARAAQQDRVLDKMLDLADEATPENVSVQKLRIWTRQWIATKLSPQKYGDKATVDANVNGKVVIEVVRRTMPDDED